MLDIDVITVNGGVLGRAEIERSGSVPSGLVRTESALDEVGEFHSLGGSRDLVVGKLLVVDTTNAEKNLDTTLLAVGDSLLDRLALAQELGLDTLVVGVDTGPTVTGKVGTGIT